jgi:nicotinamide-nucleotide adenylyltransferase
MYALKKVLSQETRIFIVIGSAQAGYTPTNPFTTSERITMVQAVLEELAIPCTRYQIIPVPDIHNYTRWVDHVKQYVPPFGVVYTGSETGAALFSNRDIPVTKISLYKKQTHSGTEVRLRMVQGKDWKQLVPDVVVRFIEEINGVQRLKSLSY